MTHRRLSPPLVLINFKCYLEAMGPRAVTLAKYAQEASQKHDATMIVAPQATDIRLVSRETSIAVFAQHVDSIKAGSHTGHTLPEAVSEAGASGVIINHSERRLHVSTIEDIISRASDLHLKSVVCANTPKIAASIAGLEPDMIAVEPPELIGSGIAVSKAKPEILTDTVTRIRRINNEVAILCGAGITSGQDVKAALALGTEGVLVASGVVRARDQANAVNELASACR